MSASNIFKVRDEHNRFLKLINKYFEFSEYLDLTIVKCKLCNSVLYAGGPMFPIRVLVLQHLVQHLKDPQIYAKLIGETKCFKDRLENNEFVMDENAEQKLK
jgi:hypothetical protein